MLLWALIACAKPLPVAEAAAPATTSVATTPPPAATPCGEWSGVSGPGTRWEARSTEAWHERWGMEGTATTVVTAASDTSVTLQYTGTFTGPGGRYDASRTTTWRCSAEGASLERIDATTAGVAGGSPMGHHVIRTFSPPLLVRPAHPVVGTSWGSAMTVTLQRPDEADLIAPTRCTSVVGADTSLTLPAGARVARRLEIVCDTFRAESPWLVQGEGWVADGDLELTRYAR